MKYQIHTLLLITFSGFLLTDLAMAKPLKKHDHSYVTWNSHKKPKYYPLAHTNQDEKEDENDDTKRMFGGIPNDLNLSSGIKFLSPVGDGGLIELMIKISTPIGADGPIPTDEVISSLSLSDQITFYSITDALSSIEESKSVVNKIAKSQPPVVPAPGALGLLALGGLFTARRRRQS